MNLYKLIQEPLSSELVGAHAADQKVPEIVWGKYKDLEFRDPILRDHLKKFEYLWATDPKYAYFYSAWFMEKPWPQAEAVIATDPIWSYAYATNVIKGAWPRGEPAIAQSDEYTKAYLRWFPDRKTELKRLRRNLEPGS